ncbi:MAG: hypothetical protein M1821_006513 [Bathelium mastoideum]|nr:MAG: hypothetical protein M1821_006513 [Bathelium mastoideum]
MDGPVDPSDPQSISSTGLTVVTSPDEPNLDIIFVHGFTGHPERTWSHKKGNIRGQTLNSDEPAEPPSKIRKLSLFPKPNTIYWPKDLLPHTVPNARVLVYGYDTHIRHKLGPPVNRNTVYDIAWDFLVALEAERREDSLRPALFIVHSLGGVVTKEMLRRSSTCCRGQSHLRDIFESTAGIMFFGSPHGGADPRGLLHRIAEKVIKAVGFSVNEQIVNTLLPTSERLRELRDTFGPMAQKQKWIIHSFQEQLGIKLLNGHKVVEDVSSYLNLPDVEVCEHIGRDHTEMCRFSGHGDGEYKKVALALRRMTDFISKSSKRSADSLLDDEQKRMLLESLRFDQIDARQMTIKAAHSKTCKWLLANSQYRDWLDVAKLNEHHGFLWIKGKPGTGKSTLMKFALASARKKMKDKTVISFFFNARGDDLEKSTTGTYRSLLLQLLERVPALQHVFELLSISPTSVSTFYQWSLESLKTLLEQAIQNLGDHAVVCFIDALDECEEPQIRDMISFFEHVGEFSVSVGIKFHVCFSSRHYPHITIRKGLDLVLEGQEGHDQDITTYVDSELNIGHNQIAEQIRSELREKASGIFMWVILVVGILNKEHDSGRMHALRRRLREIPRDLHELFSDILTRDSQDRDELFLCVQWVLFAKRPLDPRELYHAILSGVEPETFLSGELAGTTQDVVERFILNSSKGLAEITTSKVPKVQFIHESVKDFFLKRNGLGDIWPDLKNNFEGQSHERLKQCCLNYMGSDNTNQLEVRSQLTMVDTLKIARSRTADANEYPFIGYAVHHVLYHADAAAEGGIDQKGFIRTFPLSLWIDFDNLLETRKLRKHTKYASLLYILAERNLSNLIKIHPSIQSCLQVTPERYGTPLFAALATASKEAVRTLFEAQMANHLPDSRFHQLCTQYCQNEERQRRFGRSFKYSFLWTVPAHIARLGDELLLAIVLEMREFAPELKDADKSDRRIQLMWAVKKGHEAVIKLLFEREEAEVNLLSPGGTPLGLAAELGHQAVVKLLFETGSADINRVSNRRTPLELAAGNGHEAVVKLLLEVCEVELDENGMIRPSLGLAAEHGHEGVVKLLLKTGKAAVNEPFNGFSLLGLAAKTGQEAVVKLLLERGEVDANAMDQYGNTPLMIAASSGHEAVAKLLLDIGKVDVNSKDDLGRTPLVCARRNGHEAVAKLLLETGKVRTSFQDDTAADPEIRDEYIPMVIQLW